MLIDGCSMVSSHHTYLFGTIKILHAYARFHQRESASMSVYGCVQGLHSNLCVCNCVYTLLISPCILAIYAHMVDVLSSKWYKIE